MAGRWFSLGLRWRLVLALVSTSALTLAVAAATLLSPLERRLRADQIKTLSRAVDSSRGTIAALDHSELRRGSRDLLAAVRRIAARTNAQVALIDARGRLLATTAPDPGAHALARRASRAERLRISAAGSRAPVVTAALPVRNEGRSYVVEARKLLDVSSPLGVVRHAMLIAALAGLAVAGAVGFGLATRLVKRLRALRDTALRVARVGPAVEMTPDGGSDEIADLARALADMQDQLLKQEAARRTFVATASHELRTPLTSLRLMLDLLCEGIDNGSIDLAGAREQIGRGAHLTDRLGVLAGQLLDLSRIDAGIAPLMEPVDLRETTRGVLGEFAARADAAGASVRMLDDGAPVRALGDPGGVAQILRVLIDNALQFTPSGESVEVRVWAVQPRAGVSVADNGPGVVDAERDVIFERFQRGSGTAGAGGFGLGLAIARELSERMEGTLTLAETSSGAEFQLTLNGLRA